MTSDTRKEFLQKYMLDSYSRAIPTNALPGKRAVLGEYCDPVDSCKNQNNRQAEDSEDSDPGYALPQDAIESRVSQRILHSKKQSVDEDDGDLYELAQNPQEGHEVPAPKKLSPKPAPKPRASAHRRSQATNPVDAQVRASPSNEDADHEVRADSVPSEEVLSKRRPSKRVVEIEYEVASEIRSSKPSSAASTSSPQASSTSSFPSPSSHPHFEKNSSSVTSTSSPVNRKVSGTQYPVSTQVIPPTPPFTAPHGSGQDFVYTMSQPTPESVYEEPWDLKARRLKQEEEKRASSAAMSKADGPAAPRGVPAVSPSAPPESVYEDAWDSATQQRKLEAKLSFARSLSTTSETEIFHDALDNLPHRKSDDQSEKTTEPKLKPLPTDTYEDAWDLKNSVLEQKIRAMQVQASATYEEPWDLKKQHQQLKARLSSSPRVPDSAVSSQSGSKMIRQRSSSDAYDQSRAASDSHSSSFAKKQHSFDNPSRAQARLRGNNIGQRINPMIPLANQNWYHGNITRDDAEKMLRVCKEGSYIVRISSDRKSYSLSIKSAKQNIHVQIEQVSLSDGSVRYILGKNSKEFCSIPEMIDHYTHHRVPLKGAEHITLLHPVECKWSSNNSQ